MDHHLNVWTEYLGCAAVHLVDPSERRHVDGLSPDGSGAADPGGVLAGPGVDHGVDEDLEGVLPSQQVDDLEAVLDDPDGEQLLAVVAAVHHEAVDQAFHHGALGLAEPLSGEPEHENFKHWVTDDFSHSPR